jgi:iron-sulfur cluster insertion protein
MEAVLAPRNIVLTESAAMRVQTLREMEGNDRLMLRLSVSGGGCSGFSYGFTLDDQLTADDRTFEQHGVTLAVDETSLDLLSGAIIDFVEDLIGSSFVVRNPNASSTCGCGSSFSV